MTARWMDEALELARQGLGRTSPNPAVGAVLVRNGEVVGRGFHTWAGVKHGERAALEEAGDLARGATLYINLEPCSHDGRTPPCADALIQAGVAKVVAAMEDPNPRVRGEGFRKLRDAGIEIEIAAEFTEAAEAINQPFAHYMRTGRPLVLLKSAVTLDGKIAAPEDNRGWITSERAREHVQTLRHHSDAIMTGIGTVLSDDCLLTDRSGLERSRPLLRIVMDSQCRLPRESKMVQSCQNDILVVTTTASPADRRKRLEDRGVRIVLGDGPNGRASLRAGLDYLSENRYLSLMIEAGSKLNWTALESGLVDKIYFYYAPKILGGTQSLPVAGGTGRQRRVDALRFHHVTLHTIPPDEFAVEAWLEKGTQAS